MGEKGQKKAKIKKKFIKCQLFQLSNFSHYKNGRKNLKFVWLWQISKKKGALIREGQWLWEIRYPFLLEIYRNLLLVTDCMFLLVAYGTLLLDSHSFWLVTAHLFRSPIMHAFRLPSENPSLSPQFTLVAKIEWKVWYFIQFGTNSKDLLSRFSVKMPCFSPLADLARSNRHISTQEAILF